MITSDRQLLQTTIHANDFQDNSYSFPVDSVLTSGLVPGRLVISTSEGYLLTTSSLNQPKREQSLTYKKQADGRWAIHSLVTILANDQELPDGIVRIQNPETGTTILTIQGETTALARIPTSPVAVSETALSFGQMVPGQSRSLLFTISQPYTDEPVTITSDTPEYFQLATDNHPNFTASLSVKPSLVATYVHVRYLAKKAGTHSGQLVIQSAFDEHLIALTGRTARFLPAVRTTRSLNGYAQLERRNSTGWVKIAAAIVSIAVVIGLGWFGLASMNTNTPKPSATSGKTALTRPIVANSKPVEKAASAPIRVRSELNQKKIASSSVASKKQPVSPVVVDRVNNENPRIEKQLVEQRKEQKEITARVTEPLVTKRPFRQARPVPAVGESELEKELNQLTPNQP